MSVSVGRYLVEMLAANDIDTVFGIPGVHNLELYRGLAATQIRHVLVRHEQGAGFAADGYARVSGRPAAAFVISGPGLTNILTAAAQAYSDSVPMLVIASTPVRASLGKQWGVLHELSDQRALAAGVFGVARRAQSAQDVHDHLRVCLASLKVGRARPAYLEIPLDLLAEQTTLQSMRFTEGARMPRAQSAQVDAAAALLAAGERPLVIAGGGARAAAKELKTLIETLDALLATTAAGKGLLAERHPGNLGASLPYAATQALIAEADVVLAVGTEMSETDIFWSSKLTMNGRLIRIDADPAKLADHYDATLALWGDARSTLQSINEVLNGRVAPGRAGWRTQLGGAAHCRQKADAQFDARFSAPLGALKAIRAALPPDGVVFSDMTQIAYLGNYAFPCDAPGLWFHPAGYGTLGFALPAALGAKIAAPARPIIALAGDFGLQFTLGELMTAVETGLSLPIVLWNNSALGQIRDDMLAAGIPALGVVGRNPNFLALAESYGAAARRARSAAQLTDALRTALGAPGPTLIEVVDEDF